MPSLMSPFVQDDHQSKGRSPGTNPQFDLPDYETPIHEGSSSQYLPVLPPISEVVQCDVAMGRVNRNTRTAAGCGSCHAASSMQAKLDKMDRELQNHKDKILGIQGVQDAQTKIMGRILLWQAEN